MIHCMALNTASTHVHNGEGQYELEDGVETVKVRGRRWQKAPYREEDEEAGSLEGYPS